MSVRHSIVLFFAFNYSICFFGQTSSLNQVSTNSNDQLEEVYLYLQLANEAKSVDLEQALSYSRQAIQLANISRSTEARAEANELMGDLYQMMSNFQPSINYLLISGKLFESIGNKTKLAEVYGKLGMIYVTNNFNLEGAQLYFQKSLDLGIELDDQSIIANAYNKIGGIYFSQKNYDEANHYIREALSLWEQSRNEIGIAIALNNIGEIYYTKASYNTALDYFNQSMAINDKINDNSLKATNLKNIGLVKSQFGDIDEALNYFNECLKLLEVINNLERKVDIILVIGNQYYKIEQYAKAIQSYLNVYRIAIKANHWEHIADAALGLSNSFDQLNNFRSSLNYFKIYATYTDSINQQQKVDRITDLQARFKENINEKELLISKKELSLSENQIKLSTLRSNLLILSILFVLIVSFLILNRFRLQIKKVRLIREKDLQLHEAQRELMEVEIQSKDNDLINFALHLVQKNKTLQHIQKELKNLPVKSDDETSKRIAELNATIKQNLSLKEDFEEFKLKLDSTYDEFFRRLKNKFPNLTKNEERLCAFLRLNLSSKEIAAINNTSVKAAEMSRYRLRKKMELDYTELLPEYMQSI